MAAGKTFNRDVRLTGGASLYVDEVQVINGAGAYVGPIDTPDLKFSNGEFIEDNTGNELIKFAVVASAVNELTVSNNSTGLGPVLSATGETNVPITLKGKGTGAVILGQATSTGVQLVADQPLLDSAGNELVKFVATASAVNEVTITNNSTGLGPTITATGETNVPITLAGKGTGAVILGQATSTDIRLAADQPIADSSGNEYIKFSKTATAINEFTITNGAAGTGPTLSATGGDTNVNLNLTAKGSGNVRANIGGGAFIVEAAADGAAGAVCTLYQNSASPANADVIGTYRFNGKDDGGTARTYAQITSEITDVTAAGGVSGDLVFYATTNGTATEYARLVGIDGALKFAEAANIATGTTTGTKIGTATSQKIGFFNAAPIIQPTTGVAEAAFVENIGGTAVNVDSTFGGYTVQQIVQALQSLGLLA